MSSLQYALTYQQGSPNIMGTGKVQVGPYPIHIALFGRKRDQKSVIPFSDDFLENLGISENKASRFQVLLKKQP